MARRYEREETASDFVESFRAIGLGSASPDWRDTKTASQCLGHLCLSEHLSDVTLRFSEEPSVKLPAHKFVLSMRSRVFETMFYGKHGSNDRTVTIDDIGSETMRTLARFMYTDMADINGNNVLKCLQGATLYAVAGLVAKCSTFLEENIDAKNVCTIHEQAIYYNMKKLQTKCFEFMVEKASSVFKSKNFLKISKSTLVSLLKSDDLADSEENVFTGALRWAEAQCISNEMNVTPDNKRKCLGEALNKIRFPIMSIENFAKFVTPAGVLTSDEQIMLYQYLASNGTSPLNNFIAHDRCGKSVTVDMKKYWIQELQGYNAADGYNLDISLNSMYSHQGHGGWGVVKLKAVNGRFTAKVKKVCIGNIPLKRHDFTVQGDKIIFHSPICISNRINIIFETTQGQGMYGTGREISQKINYTAHVKGNSINISQIPDGLTSITFAK